MIDKNNGKVHFDNPAIILSSDFNSKNAADLCKTKKLKNVLKNNEYELYNFQQWEAQGQIFSANLIFGNGTLVEIHLTKKGVNEPTSWGKWNEKAEIEKKAIHDKFVAKEFNIKSVDNSGTYSFSWGKVESIRDARDGDAVIIIRYVKECIGE